MKVTVITITLNSEKTLENTIKSVAAQDYDDLEYIIIDGGSKDGTLNIIKKYEHVVTKWISEPDKGISDAFNKGINMSTGELIGIINSDDTLLEGAIQRIVSGLKNNVDVIYGNGLRIYAHGKMKPYIANSFPESLKNGMTFVHPATFVRKSAYCKYGLFNLNYKCVMDRELLLRMYHQGAVFQYSDHFYVTYSMGGLSDKRYFDYVLPEDYSINIKNGMLEWKAKCKYSRNAFTYIAVKLRNKLLGYE